jgi:hypothetical protein
MVRAGDALVARFTEDGGEEQPAPSTPAAARGEAPAETAGRPFDITEYTAAAESIGRAAHELGAAIATLDQSLPRVERALERAGAQADRSVDHAFARALAPGRGARRRRAGGAPRAPGARWRDPGRGGAAA